MVLGSNSDILRYNGWLLYVLVLVAPGTAWSLSVRQAEFFLVSSNRVLYDTVLMECIASGVIR